MIVDGTLFSLPWGYTLDQMPSAAMLDETSKAYHAAWRELHNKEYATPAWLDDWVARLPDMGCRCQDGYLDIIKTLPPVFGAGWFRWTFELRNRVREKLAKTPWEYSEALKLWRPAQAWGNQPSIAAFVAVTSLDPRATERQAKALDSWKRLGLDVVSVNTGAEISILRDQYPQVTRWIESNAQGDFYSPPTQLINRLLDVATEVPALVINSDIEIYGDQSRLLEIVEQRKPMIGIRHNYETQPGDASQEVWGLDAFMVYPEIVAQLPEVVYSIGKPMWDYWAAWTIERASQVGVEWIGEPYFFHRAHPVNWSADDCERGHKHFAETIGQQDWHEWRKSRPFWIG